MTTISKKAWKSLINSKELGLDGLHAEALWTYARVLLEEEVKNGRLDEESKEEFEETTPSQGMELAKDFRKNQGPSWWPRNMGRIRISLSWISDKDGQEDDRPPITINPGKTEGGLPHVLQGLLQQLASIGSIFKGEINIEISRIDKTDGWLAGRSVQVSIGQSVEEEKSGGKGGSLSTEQTDYLFKKWQESMDVGISMLGGVSNAMHASAAMVHAAKGSIYGEDATEDDGDESWQGRVAEFATDLGRAWLISNGEDDEDAIGDGSNGNKGQKQISFAPSHMPKNALVIAGHGTDFTGPPPDPYADEVDPAQPIDDDWNDWDGEQEDQGWDEQPDHEEEEEEEAEDDEDSEDWEPAPTPDHAESDLKAAFNNLSEEDAIALLQQRLMGANKVSKRKMKKLAMKKLLPHL